jgi:hypothetical protein
MPKNGRDLRDPRIHDSQPLEPSGTKVPCALLHGSDEAYLAHLRSIGSAWHCGTVALLAFEQSESAMQNLSS